MNDIVDHDSTLKGYAGPGTTWAIEMNFVMNHVTGAGLRDQPVDLQSSALPMCYDCPPPP